MKRTLILAALFMSMSLTGCMKKYHSEVLVDIQTSEIAFMINTVNDSGQAVITPQGKGGKGEGADSNGSDSNFYTDHMLNARKVKIPYYFHSTGRLPNSGDWRPMARLITVNTAPCTREWSAGTDTGTSSRNQGIWVESADSVGFSTGISITARIENKEDAITFLGNYPPEHKREIKRGEKTIFSVEVTGLTHVMDDEIRQKIQEVYAQECNKHSMDDLRSKKNEIMDTVKEVVIPFFAERGVTITTLGQFGGFTYENKQIQESIDNVFKAQQDKEVAKAEAEAAEERKVALKLKGEGAAEQVRMEAQGEADAVETKAKAEAAAIQLVADAKAYELEKLQENPEAYMELKQLELQADYLRTWDGKLPVYSMGGGNTPDLLMQVPGAEK